MPNVITRVREKEMQRVVHLQFLAADRYRIEEVLVGERRKCGEEYVPSAVPLLEQIRAGNVVTCVEFRIALAPWLLAIGSEEAGKSRFQISGDVPDDDR